MSRKYELGKSVCQEARGDDPEERGSASRVAKRAERRLRSVELPRVGVKPRPADEESRERDDEAVREDPDAREGGRPSPAVARHDRSDEVLRQATERRAGRLDGAHDDRDRPAELETAATPGVGDEAKACLAKRRGVSRRPEVQEDAHGGDREEEVAERAREVPDAGERPLRPQALSASEEHQGEEPRGDHAEDERSLPSGQRPREGARRPGRAAALEDRDARGDETHEDVDESAREEPEPRERLGSALLRSGRQERHRAIVGWEE
jgi:hypothetical protein